MSMKKVLSLMLAFVMLLLPMTVLATEAELGAYDNPYQLSTTSVRFAVTVAPESEAWVQVDDCNGSVVTVGYATGASYMIMYCRQPYYPETESGDNTASLTMVSGADMFSVYNSGTESVVVYMSLTAGPPVDNTGTVDNPETVTLAANMFGGVGAYVSKDLDAGNQGYYYTCIVPSDGLLSVGVDAVDADYNDIGWMYSVNNMTTYQYGDNHFSDDEEPVYYELLDVSAGDEIVVFVSTYDPNNMFANPAGTVSVNFSLEAVGTWGNPEDITAGAYATDIAAGSQGYYYTWTASEAGIATVTMNDTTGWQFSVNGAMADGSSVYGDTHWYNDEPVVAAEEIEVAVGDVLTIWVSTYNAEDQWNTPEGTINWTLSFKAGTTGGDGGDNGDGGNGDGGDVGGDVNYVQSGTALEVGTKEYTVDPMYQYTVFTFEPTETGKYTFTVTDGQIGLVSTNGMWITTEPSAESVAANTLTWECTGVGQGIWVAVMANTNAANITISKEGIVVDEVPWTDYENKITPEAFTFTGNAEDMLYVDTEDDTVDSAVLGEDGFYHLNSADGPILYVDLDDAMMSLVDAMGYGQLKDIVYDGEEIVSKVDYNTAFGAYVACADSASMLYPLTEDLMTVYKNVGHYQGWYGEDGWVGGTEEDAWMFACYYVKDASSDDNTSSEDNISSEDPASSDAQTSSESASSEATPGDAGVIVFVFLGILAVVGVAVVARARR